MRLKGVKTAVVALLLAFQGPVVLATEADSLRTDSERFAWQQLVAPTVLFSAGAVGVKSEWFRTRINEPVRDYAARIRGENAIQFEDYIQYAPGAAYLGLGFAVQPKHGFAERTMAACTACSAWRTKTSPCLPSPTPTAAPPDFPWRCVSDAPLLFPACPSQYGTG